MYARIVRGQARSGKPDDLVRAFQETVPGVTREAGNQGIGLMVDRLAKKIIAYTLWDTEAALAASEQSGGSCAVSLATIAPFYVGQPAPEHYEVNSMLAPGQVGQVARITTLYIRPSKLPEALTILRGLGENIARQPGNKGLSIISDARTGKALAITLWESDATLVASEESGFEGQQWAKLAGKLTQQSGAAEDFTLAVRA